MTKTKDFSAVLARIRRERGFPSAHQFFKGVGGSRSLGLSFVSYWDLERGKKLPKSWRLKAIIAALGIGPYSREAQELVRAYFKALSGSDELVQILSAVPPPAAGLPAADLAQTAAHRAISQLSVNLTLEQWRVRTRDMLTNACQSFLAETEGWVTVKEISEATKFRPDAVRKSLKALAAGGLIDLSGDKARGKLTGKVIQLLPLTPATFPIRVALKNHWDKWLNGCKQVALKRHVVRMSKASLDQYRQHLEKAVDLAAVYGNPGEDRHGSAVYFVEGSVYKIFPKD